MLRVYLASKSYMVDGWKRLREQMIDVEVTSRWIDYGTATVSTKELEKRARENMQDIERCDCIIVYGSEDDILVDTLIAAGMGLMAKKVIICVGSSKSFGSWLQDENVYREKSIIDALALGRKLFG